LERRFQPVLVRELDSVETWEVLTARRPRLERHHAVAISDDALKAAIVLTDRFIGDRAQPDKAIDVLDEACAGAQARARVSPELDRLIRERRKVDALIRRKLKAGESVEEAEGAGDVVTDDDPLARIADEVLPMIDRVAEEIRKALGGGGRGRTETDRVEPSPSVSTHPVSLADRRDELDRLLRAELEAQGVVVAGRDVVAVVAAATGQRIEWSDA
ncbi:MAG: hypothetical protein ACREN5_05150, partial [Gemmatimonadales bacterium]